MPMCSGAASDCSIGADCGVGSALQRSAADRNVVAEAQRALLEECDGVSERGGGRMPVTQSF